MAVIGLICADPEDRHRLSLIAGETGHQVHGAARLHEGVEILQELRPKLMLVVDSRDHDASVVVREVLRAAPLMPVVVALKERDSSRAVSLMRAGAAEVVAPPWTRESVRACVSKSLRFQGTSLSLVKTPRPRNAPVYAAAALIFFASCFGYKAVERAKRLRAEAAAAAAISHWDLPYAHPSAMTFADGRVWIADWFSQSIYVHDPATMAVARVIHFPAEMPVALAVGGDTAWSVGAGGIVSRRMKDAQLTEVQRVAAPRTVGLAYDGLYVWTAEPGRLLKRLPDASLSVLESYKYAGLKPAGLVWDGGSLWSLDAGNRELLRHDVDNPELVTERVSLKEYADGRYKPVAVGFDGKRFWTIGERLPSGSGPARLFRHSETAP